MTTRTTSARHIIHNILFSKGRMEALTDGIFAIAMTLMVLELKVPELPKVASAHDLLHAIAQEKSAMFSFIFSFLYCGVLWVFHPMAMHFIRHMQLKLVWLNLLFLMAVSTMPFSCGLLAHFIENRAAQEVYFGNMFAAAASLAIIWLAAKKKKLINADDPYRAHLIGQQIVFFPVALLGGMVAAYFNRQAAFIVFAGILFLFRLWQARWHRSQPMKEAQEQNNASLAH